MRASYLVLCLIALMGLGCGGSGNSVVPSGVDTTAFDGEYRLIPEASFTKLREEIAYAMDPRRRRDLESLLQSQIRQYRNFTIRLGVIRSGTDTVQEFSLSDATIEGTTLRGTAIWHEDVRDPGDMNEVAVTLTFTGDRLEFFIGPLESTPIPTVVLMRVRR